MAAHLHAACFRQAIGGVAVSYAIWVKVGRYYRRSLQLVWTGTNTGADGVKVRGYNGYDTDANPADGAGGLLQVRDSTGAIVTQPITAAGIYDISEPYCERIQVERVSGGGATIKADVTIDALRID